MTGIQDTKLTLKDIGYILGLFVVLAGSVAAYSSKSAKQDAKIESIEKDVLVNKAQLSKHNLDLFDYKLNAMDEKLDKIMDKLNI